MARLSDGSVEEQVARLVAIEEIKALRSRYWRFVDTKKWDDFGRLFATDATFMDHAAQFGCNGREEIQGNISAVLQPALSVHQGHQYEIEVLSDTTARGIWVMYDHLEFPPGPITPQDPYAGAHVDGWGHYLDEYVKVDGEWLFQTVNLNRLRLTVNSPSSTEYPPVPGS